MQYVDDTLLSCLVAATLVVVAHGIDGLGPRDDDGEGMARSLALALCGLALGLLAVAAFFATTRTDLLIVVCTAAATLVSLMPLVGLLPGGVRHQVRRINPWDRAFRIRPTRAADLLTPAASPGRTGASAQSQTVPSATPAPRAVTAASANQASSPSSDPAPTAAVAPEVHEVHEAEETLHDVSAVVGDLDRLLGLDHRPRRP